MLVGAISAQSSAKAAQMNFDGGLITSDGAGNEQVANDLSCSNLIISSYFLNPVRDGVYSFLGSQVPSINLASGNSLGGGAINFFTFGNYGNQGNGLVTDSPSATVGFLDMGNYTGELLFYINNGGGVTNGTSPLMAVGNGGYYQSSGVGGVVIGSGWLSGTPFSVPNDSLCVQSNLGVGTLSPSYSVDVAGDINFTGALRKNGVAVVQNDSAGHGGTTLMLRASNNGTPMYLHVTSSGVATWTTTP